MKIFRNRTIINYIVLTISLCLIEIIFRLISHTTVFNLAFIRSFLGISILTIILGYLNSLLKPRFNAILNCLIVFIAGIYVWIQLGFNAYIGVYMSANSSSQLGAVTDYIKDFLASITAIDYLVFIPFILLIILYLVYFKIIRHKLNHKLFTYKYYKLVSTCLMLILLGASIGSYYLFLGDKFIEDDYQTITNKELFLTASNSGLCVREFGIIPFAFIDLKSKFINNDHIIDLTINTPPNNNSESDRQFDDRAWQTLISEEKNKTYNTLNNYFINTNITNRNEMTGLFEDKNVIVIMMESVNDIIMNPEYFPNFYKMASEGWYFENNYSPRNSCATGNNEFSALTGLYSIYNNCTTNTYYNNKYFTAMFNLFNRKGYTTNSFHDYSDAYYYRTKYHPNMGSGHYYSAGRLGMKVYPYYGGWASDEELMEKYLGIIDTIKQDKPFMSYITTVSSHQPYTVSSPFGDMYLDMTKDTDYSMTIRRYLSKLKVVDNALGILLEGLEERGILDDTVIVMFGDHYPYGIPINTLKEVLTRDLTDYENEKVPLVIYNSQMESKKYSTYTSYLNLTPTLANLFNLDYDPRLYMGEDIFNKDYKNIVVFADTSWKNDLAYYDASTGKITYFTDFKYTASEIKNINQVISNEMRISTLAIKNNYFNYLDNKLTKIKERAECQVNEGPETETNERNITE